MPDPEIDEFGIPIKKKPEAEVDEFGIPVKKKSLLSSQSQSPSVSLGGESELENGASVPSGIDYLGGQNFNTPITDFEQRIANPSLSISNPDGTTSTHKMMSFVSDGKYYAAPTIVNIKGKLKELSIKEAIDYALKNKEFKEFKTEKDAQDYAEGRYKIGSPLQETLQTNEPDLNQLHAITTPGETTAKDISNFSPEIQKTGLLMGEKKEALARGLAKTGSLLIQTPAFLYDIASTVTNKVINQPLGIPDAPTSNELSQQTGITNPAVSDLETAIKNSKEVQDKKYDQEIHQYLFGDKKDLKKGANLLADQILESLPTSMALMFGAASAPITSAATGALAFGADKKRQIDEVAPNLPEDQKVALATFSGGMEMAFEELGLTKLGPMLKGTFAKLGKEATEKQAKEIFTQTYGKVLKRYLGVHAEEVAGEMANQFSQNVLDKYSGIDPKKNLMDGVFDSGLIATGSSIGMTTPAALADIAVTKSLRKKAHDFQDQKEILSTDLQSKDVTPEAKEAISKKLKDINEQEADLAAEQRTKNETLNPDQKKEVNDLLQQSKKIADAAVDISISDETKEILKKDLDGIDKQIDDVYEEAKKNKPEEVVTPKTENTDIQDEVDYLNEIKNSGIPLTEEENARLTELQPEEITNQKPITNEQNSQKTKKTEEANVLSTSSENQQESPVGYLTSNVEQNVIKERNIQQSGESEHPNRDEGRKTTTPGDSDSDVEGRKVKQEKIIEKTPVEKKAGVSNELIDEEDQIDAEKKDDDAVVQKMNYDIEAMKQMRTEDLAEKKFVGMIERAWKAKEAGKITRPTYTAFRNKAKDILGGKIGAKDNVDSTEAKLKVTAALNKVKERLIGQDYKKITLSTGIPITPQNISDLIDLTNSIIHRGIDAGFTIAEATAKALTAIKKHPAYKKLVASKEINEKDFEKSIKEVKTASKKEPSTKEKVEVPDEITNGKGKRKIADRQKENKRFDEISKTITDEEYNMYNKIDQKKANQYIKDKISQFEKEGLVEELANRMLDDDSPFPDELSLKAPLFLADRLWVIAENEGNEFTKNALNKLAGKINAMAAMNTTPAAQKIGLLSDINETLPLSVEGLKEFAREKISQIQDQNLSKDQQSEIKQATLSFNEILETEEIKKQIDKMVEAEIIRVSEETKGKEWTNKAVDAIESLKIDLSEC